MLAPWFEMSRTIAKSCTILNLQITPFRPEVGE